MTDEPEGYDDLPGSDESLADLAERVHAELQATEELPVERDASRWIGEAQAVAGDAASSDLPNHVVRERVGHVEELLANVEGTGSDAADERVERASVIAARITTDS